MNIFFVSSEAYPFSKTGGLADMAYFLPKSLKMLGHDVKVITPYYEQIKSYSRDMTFLGKKTIHINHETWMFNYYEMNYEGISYIFVQNMMFFEREHFYGYDDDMIRFAAFDYAVLELFSLIDSYPSLLHINDWQTGMIPYLLDEIYRSKNEKYFAIHTLLTIHNLQYQGSFNKDLYGYFSEYFDYTYIHFDSINFLKAGIERATKINTVSPTYKDQILTQTYGFTLDGILNKRKDDLYGILNGIDEKIFNPQTDPLIKINYQIKNAVSSKKIIKKQILEKFNLNTDTSIPLIIYIGRLADQKGIELILNSIQDCLDFTVGNFILLGSGNPKYEDRIKYLSHFNPSRVASYIGFNEALAHELYAAADLFLMPSIFEPCGLGQMIAMRYGTLPIVRETGGLKDTVIPYNKYTRGGTGFSFIHPTNYDFKQQIFAAIDLYINNKLDFNYLVRQAMRQDFGVKRMAIAYESIYKKILGA